MRPAMTVLKGVAALIATVAVTIGIPAALIIGVGWPLPTTIPAWADISATLDGTLPLDPALVYKTMAVGVWIAWAQLVASLGLEIVAVTRGGVARTVPGLAATQRLASGLVGAILLVVPAAPAVAAAGAGTGDLADAQRLATTTVVENLPVVDIDSPVNPDPGAVDETPAESQAVEHVVERRDTLWGIAQHYLAPGGTPEEVSAAVATIFEANAGHQQPDGHTLTDAGLLRPGWVLTIPGATPEPAPEPVAADTGTVVVESGDTLWAIAEINLGDGHRHTELSGLNSTDNGGPIEHPDRIEPGWTLRLPTDDAVTKDVSAPNLPPPPAKPAPQPAEKAPEPDAFEPQGSVTKPAPPEAHTPPAPAHDPVPVDEATPAPPRAPAPTVQDHQPETPAAPEPAQDAAPAPVEEPVAEDPVQPDEVFAAVGDAEDLAEGGHSDEMSLVAPVGLLGGGVATAGLVFLLDRRRRARQRCRKRGELIAVPPPPLAEAEQRLRAGARPDRAALIDAALRAAAAGVGSTGLGTIRWVEATDDTVTIVLAEPAPAPAGFDPAGPDRWAIAASLADLETFGRNATSPAPALCPLGTTADGTEVLIDLETVGALHVDGPPERVTGFVRSAAAALATARWAQQPQVILAGLSGDLTTLPWVATAPSLRDALVAATARITETDHQLASLGCSTTAQARAVGETPDAWEPLIVMSAAAPTELDGVQLDTVADHPHHTVAVLTVAGDHPHPNTMSIAADGTVTLAGLDPVVTARRLDESDTRLVIDLVVEAATADAVTATDHAVTPVRTTRDAPPIDHPRPDTTDEAEAPVTLDELMGSVDVVVRVLGDVTVTRRSDGTEQPVVTGKQKATEAIVYLALREASVPRDDVQAALWPTGETTAKTFNNVMSAARSSLGDTRDGERLLPAATGGQYALSDRVVTDYGLFYELTQIAEDTDDPDTAAELLAQGLSLVAGEPFVGAGRGYAWVAPHSGMIVAQVVDAAEELAEIRLATGDWRGAEWAARQGLRAMPCDERMYRLLMRTAHAAGSIPGVQRAFRELCDAVADPDHGTEPDDTVHPETVALLEELTGKVGERASA